MITQIRRCRAGPMSRVRLVSRGGIDYARRFPWIVEVARKRRQRQFIIDGEVVLLIFHGTSDFDGLHSGKYNEAVQLYAFGILALEGDDLRKLPLSLRKTDLAQLLRGRPDGIFVAPFEQGEIGPDLFKAACQLGALRAWCQSGLIAPIAPDGRRTGSRSRTASIRPIGGCRISSRACT